MVMETVSLFREGIDAIKEAGGQTTKLCYQCGLCNTTCPLNIVGTFRVRGMIREADFGLVGFEAADMWRCVTCGACVQHCPRGVELVNVMRAVRRVIVDLGVARREMK